MAAIIGVVALGAAVALSGGWPDPRRAFDLLSGHSVNGVTEAALLTLLCWTAVLTLAIAVALALRRRPGRHSAASPWLAIGILVIGVAILGGGLAHHAGYRVCCATPATAQEAASSVR